MSTLFKIFLPILIFSISYFALKNHRSLKENRDWEEKYWDRIKEEDR